VPSGPLLNIAQMQLKVEIRAEGFWSSNVLLPDPCADGSNADCVRRSGVPGNPADTCRDEVIFDVTTMSGNINALGSVADKFKCGSGSGPGEAVIRQVFVWVNINTADINPPDWRLLARPTWSPSTNLNFTD